MRKQTSNVGKSYIQSIGFTQIKTKSQTELSMTKRLLKELIKYLATVRKPDGTLELSLRGSSAGRQKINQDLY